MTILKRLSLFAVFAVLGTTSLMAQSAARLNGGSGTVEVFRNNQWMTLVSGGLINSGEKLRTGVDSSAAVEFSSGQVITVNANSEIQIADLNRRVYVAGARRVFGHGAAVCPNYTLYPYVVYGSPAAPLALPAYPSNQVIPPMTDPLRPPVHYPANPFPVR